jgi:hypothetical protein
MVTCWEETLPDDRHLDFYDRYEGLGGESYDDLDFFDSYDDNDDSYVTKSIEMEEY